MSSQHPDSKIEQILKISKTIAVVGLSADRGKASYQVADYLQRNGYTIYPVNPKYKEILGRRCYACLNEIPDIIDIVDIFRKPAFITPIVKESIEIGVKVIWMQLGIINEEAAQIARHAGLQVIMDRCLKIEHLLLKH
jgi:uncharacterized protein